MHRWIYSQIMENDYQIAVSKQVANNLKFPSKCAYCLEATPSPHHMIVKHKQVKGYQLRVPYCETHSRMIRYMKLVHYGALSFALLLAFLIGRYLHNNRVFVFGLTGYNYLVAGFIGLVVWALTFFLLHFLVLWQFEAKGSIDKQGAVEIVGVHADGFVLLFHNKTFGREFAKLNHSTLIYGTVI